MRLRHRLCEAAAGFTALLAVLACHARPASAQQVLVIVNDASDTSLAIGAYYAEARHIPPQNICHLPPTCPADETVDRATFDACIRDPISTYLSTTGLDDTILYIVTTKGVPLRILEDDPSDDDYGIPPTIDRASVDSELCLLPTPHGIAGFMYNPYYACTQPFEDWQPRPWQPRIYLVCRLTGFEIDDDHDGIPDDVKRLIDRSLMPADIFEGLAVLDEDPHKQGDAEDGNEWMEDAAALLSAGGVPVLLDETEDFVGGADGIAAYCSWGSNDACAPPPPYYTPDTPGTFAYGALATTYVSFNARTFTWGETGPDYVQSLVADLIYLGVSGAQGHTWEPYLDAVARPQVLFPRYASGWNLADSYWAATPFISWQEVVVGDPLMRLGQQPPQPSADLDVGWNLLSLPVQPETGDVDEVFADLIEAGNMMENQLFRCPPGGAQYEMYPLDFDEVSSDFGYWLYIFNAAAVSTEGTVRTEDAVFPLRKGWTLVPYPFVAPQSPANLRFTLDGQEKPLAEAAQAGWTAPEVYFFTPDGYLSCGPYEDADDHMLRPWRAYWCVAYVPGVTLRIPACPGPTAPPPRGDLVPPAAEGGMRPRDVGSP